MKRAYTKPDVFFESFALNTAISANCEKRANFAPDICGYEYTDSINVFTIEVAGCRSGVVLDRNDEFDGICYHNPTDLNNLFNS